MKFIPQQIQLKNGAEVWIREASIEDADALRTLVRNYLDTSPYIPKSTSEFQLTLEQEIAWIATFQASEHSLLLVAEHENQLIGNIDLTGNKRSVMQHNAVIGMGILLEWRNQGLGSALMFHAIAWARINPILENLQLEVYATNLSGRNLYTKMGFRENGIIPNLFKENGEYTDSILMHLNVKAAE